MSQPSTPHDQDLVLGGQFPPPIGGAVLGGLAGLEQRFNQSPIEQKISALTEATQYGTSALPLLQSGLEDADLNVRMVAFQQLKSLQPHNPTLERGIPLKVGDRLYAVYESSVSYGDDFYYIHNQIDQWEDDPEWQEEYSIYHASEDANGAFVYLSDAPDDNRIDPYDEGYNPILIAYNPNLEAATAKAKAVYEAKFSDLGCEIYELEQFENSEDNSSEGFDLKNWVETHQISVNAKLPENWGDDDWTYRNRVLKSLQNQNQFSLLRELWQQLGFQSLGFVHEYVIDRPCYLRLSALET